MKLRDGLPVLVACLTVGCGEVRPTDEAEDVETRLSHLWQGATLWPRSGTGPARIQVCFNGADFAPETRTAMRQAVEGSWEQVANIDFWGWGTCTSFPPMPTGIKVKNDPSLSPLVFALTDVGFRESSPILARFNGDLPSTHTVIHEFGHALGFIHEDDDEASTLCAQRTGGGRSLELEDDRFKSIMRSGACAGDPTTLSAWDIMGVRMAYGNKPPGTIAGMSGLSLTISGAGAFVGLPIVGMPATGAGVNTWETRIGGLRARPGSIQRCLAVRGGAVSSGGPTPLESAACDDLVPAHQKFTFAGVQLRAMGNMCVAADSATVNAKLSIQNCDGSALQKWDVLGSPSFFVSPAVTFMRLTGNNLCVQVPGTPALGTQLILASCTLLANQTFQKQSLGRIGFGGLCFNVTTGSAAVGNRIQLWDGCTTNPPHQNEVFTLFGQIKSMGQCVNLAGGVPFDGVPINMFPCHNNGAANELWETYW